MSLSDEITLKQARELLLKKHAAALHRIRELVANANKGTAKDLETTLERARESEEAMAEDLLRLDQLIRHVQPIVMSERDWENPLKP